jgi:hypothetical protein
MDDDDLLVLSSEDERRPLSYRDVILMPAASPTPAVAARLPAATSSPARLQSPPLAPTPTAPQLVRRRPAWRSRHRRAPELVIVLPVRRSPHPAARQVPHREQISNQLRARLGLRQGQASRTLPRQCLASAAGQQGRGHAFGVPRVDADSF